VETNLIGTAEACELLSIHRSTLARWVTDGRVKPAIELRGATGARLFRRRDIEALRDQETAS
jgi:excisionase family DNA binding protein